MIYPEIRSIRSPDLEPPNLPEDPTDCEVSFQMSVGPKDGAEEESFAFTVVTPIRLAQGAEPSGAGESSSFSSSIGRRSRRRSPSCSRNAGGLPGAK